MFSTPRSVSASKSATKVRFGDFEYDPQRHELRKGAIRVRIQKQPMAILLTLLESPGSLVTRDELRSQLWDSTTFVAFEHGLNSAMKRLRDALCDSADNPRYIETVPGEGYRFIGRVETLTAPLTTSTEGAHPPNSPVAPRERLGTSNRLWPWAAGVALAMAIALAFAVFGRRPSGKPSLNFQARDWVLISNFENRTGQPVLDGTLEYAVARELSNSQFVNVVPPERIADALRLMRKPLETKIDASIGREICLRDGGIRALLTGRVEKIGSTYVLSANLVDPVRDVTVASLSEEDPADSQMAAAIRRLSDRVRETLGEEYKLVQQSDQRLEKVTTPSLHALQLYTQADQAIRLDKDDVAAPLLERALQEDQDFASAHLLLGFAYFNVGNEKKALPHFQRAFELADSVPDRERLFILGSYYDGVVKDKQKATENYEALLRLYPDHYWGTNNLSIDYMSLGQLDGIPNLWIRHAQIDPSDLDANLDAAWVKAIKEQDWNAAQPYFERANSLAGLSVDSHNYVSGVLKVMKIHETWANGNVAEAYQELIQNAKTLDPAERGKFWMTFGKLKEAEQDFRSLPELQGPENLIGAVLYVRGDWTAIKRYLPEEQRMLLPRSLSYMLMARAGMWSYVETARRKHAWESGSKLVEGELALSRGQTAKAISLLEDGLNDSLSVSDVAFFVASESLARTYERQGKLAEALRVLERASAERKRAYASPWFGGGSIAWAWMKIELQLANLYRKVGRIQDAGKIEDELSKLLIYADPDHPILRALQTDHRQVPAPRGD